MGRKDSMLYLHELETIDAMIIGASVEEAEEKARQIRGTIMRLKLD